MPIQIQQLVGNWEKITDSACCRAYPNSIQFLESGLYSGKNASPGTYTHWDAGTFEIVGPEQIMISIANDAIVAYEVSIQGDVLRFKDPDQCEFCYRKSPRPSPTPISGKGG
jgi:hypothetical protein